MGRYTQDIYFYQLHIQLVWFGAYKKDGRRKMVYKNTGIGIIRAEKKRTIWEELERQMKQQRKYIWISKR